MPRDMTAIVSEMTDEAGPEHAPRYEKGSGPNRRFWQIERRGTVVTTWSGVIGKKSRRVERTFADDRAAKNQFATWVSDKCAEGYASSSRRRARYRLSAA